MLFVFVIRMFLGAIFLSSALSKLYRRDQFEKAVLDYAILPMPMARVYTFLLPWIELAVGLLFLMGFALHLAAFMALFLLVSFILALIVNLKRNRSIKCHCSGLLGNNDISWGTVIRNMVLLTLTGILIATAPDSLSWSQWLNNWQSDILLLSSANLLLLASFLLVFGFVVLVLIDRVLSLNKEYL